MAPTKSSKKDKRVRPKLTQAQKEARHEKFVDLTNAIDEAHGSYQDAAREIAEKYGRYVQPSTRQLLLLTALKNL